MNSNFEPILFSFDIKTFNKKDSLNPATVLDVTSLFSNDVKPLGLSIGQRKKHKISRLDASRTFIESIKSYPKNIESRHVKTYFSTGAPSNRDLGSISVEMNNSMILLPKEAL